MVTNMVVCGKRVSMVFVFRGLLTVGFNSKLYWRRVSRSQQMGKKQGNVTVLVRLAKNDKT